MKPKPLIDWYNFVRDRDTNGLFDLLAEDVVFYSPIVYTPLIGKAITNAYLTAAVDVLSSNVFGYVREVIGEREAVIEFETEVDGIVINGVDMIKWNEDDEITEFKVMVRPLKAINLIHQKMSDVLSRPKPTSREGY